MTDTNLLTEIRDKMRDLAAMEHVECRDVVMGLLLTIMDVAMEVGGETAHLLCHIHGDAQQAWRKAHRLSCPQWLVLHGADWDDLSSEQRDEIRDLYWRMQSERPKVTLTRLTVQADLLLTGAMTFSAMKAEGKEKPDEPTR